MDKVHTPYILLKYQALKSREESSLESENSDKNSRIQKTHANLQTIIKASVKFKKHPPKTVGGVAQTRYPLQSRHHAPRTTHYFSYFSRLKSEILHDLFSIQDTSIWCSKVTNKHA